MDITVPPEVEELARRTRDFIREVVIPVEEGVGGSVHAAPDELRRSLQKQASQVSLRTDISEEVKRRFLPGLKAGVWSPQS